MAHMTSGAAGPVDPAFGGGVAALGLWSWEASRQQAVRSCDLTVVTRSVAFGEKAVASACPA